MVDGTEKRLPKSSDVKLRDIAERTGLNISTVSRALRGERRWVSEAVIAQVRAIAAEMGYNPSLSHSARRLALQKYGQRPLSHVIAVLIPPQISGGNVFSTYFTCTFEAVLDTCAPQGFGIFTTYNNQPPHPLILRGEVDGLISVAQPLSDYPEINSLDIPMITLNNPEPGFPAVGVDDQGGAALALGHLLDLGHRHIAYCHNPAKMSVIGHARIAGYQQACQERGIDPETVLHCTEKANAPGWGWAALAQRLLLLLDAQPEITAILARNDHEASLIWQLLLQRGLRVPDDISLVGFDDASPITNEAGINILTTVHAPLREIGCEGARLLLQHLLHEEPIPPRTILPTDLVERGTTGPPRA
ncbi:MAG TPA: LacI family DNA-binding transcriptional regulator [Armatimonadota bacterium]|jgi:DNA-binding LacI/PurR family transcriptional regulator